MVKQIGKPLLTGFSVTYVVRGHLMAVCFRCIKREHNGLPYWVCPSVCTLYVKNTLYRFFFYFYFADRASQYTCLNINQLDALNFIMSLLHASTCFEHVFIVRRSKLYYSASGMITPIGVMIPYLCTGRPPIGVMLPQAV